MKVLVCGMPRSASTWSYNVCKALCEAVGRDLHPASGLYEIDNFPADLHPAPDDTRILLLKIHFPPTELLRDCDNGASRIVYTVRDPRTATASLMKTFGTSFKNAARQVHKSLLIWEYLALHGKGVIVRYGDVSEDAAGAVARMARYLGLDVDAQTCAEIADSLRREKLRKEVAKLSAKEDLNTLSDIRHDPQSLLTEKHFSSDKETDWATDLTAAQQRFTLWIWKKWIGALAANQAETSDRTGPGACRACRVHGQIKALETGALVDGLSAG